MTCTWDAVIFARSVSFSIFPSSLSVWCQMPSALPGPKTHMFTHAHVCIYQHATTDCENLSLSSHRAKDGGQGEVSGCPHHLVVIKAHCMLGRIVKLPTETLDMYIVCVLILQRDSHTHTHCCSTRGISQPLSKYELYRVLSQFGAKYLHWPSVWRLYRLQPFLKTSGSPQRSAGVLVVCCQTFCLTVRARFNCSVSCHLLCICVCSVWIQINDFIIFWMWSI